ncbi:MAG TPA: peptidyl-alpha-hydroxyglycine alpha-amidating lyase family protein [Terriglobia bacterium]|nr:peptidyl-alpha-hydroxyglycine alpha-amidating lyase family protein [Terriglobia bacterium]
MKTGLVLGLLLFLSVPLLAQQPAPEIPYQSDPNFLKLPQGTYLGEAAGVALNSKGDIFVYNRGEKTRLLEFDPNGNYLRTIGDGLYGFVFAHSVKIDKDDNIWCVDEGSSTVIEFDPTGRHVKMVLGRRPEPSSHQQPGQPEPPASDWLFNRPTDVAFDSSGDLFVTDGYVNSRVVKYDKFGNRLKDWGTRGTAPGQFHTPHTIAVDANDRVYVGDRENNRIQVFDADGDFITQWTNVGAPWALCITPGPHQVIYSSDSRPGHIYKLDLNGKILGEFGTAGKQTGQFGWVHQIACPSENVLFVGELLNWRVQKLVLNPTK